jgi:hypothetical protein
MAIAGFDSALLVLYFLLLLLLLLGLVLGFRTLFFGERIDWRVARVVGVHTALTYVGTYVTSRLIFPFTRSDLLAPLTDPRLATAAGFFSIKEGVASLGVIVAVGLLLLALFGNLRDTTLQRRQLFGSLFATLGLVTVVLLAIALGTLR